MLTDISGVLRTSAHVKQRINDLKKYANSYLNRTVGLVTVTETKTDIFQTKTNGRNIFHKSYVKKLAAVLAEEASKTPLHELLNDESAADLSHDDASTSSHHIESPQIVVPKTESVELPMTIPMVPVDPPR